MKKLAFSICLLFSITCLAGGWPKEKGKGYYKLGYSFINGRHFFDDQGNKVALERSLGFYNTSFYGEYGLTDRLTVIAYVPFATTAKLEDVSGSPGGSLTTIGDTNLGFRYGLITGKPNVLSASVMLGLPFGQTSDDTSGGVESLQTGDGEFNQLIKLESGHSLGNGFYTSSFLGFNFRSKGFSEEIRFGGEVGHVSDQLIGILKFQSISSLKNGDNTTEANADFFNNNMELFSVAPEVAVRFSERFGLSINYTVYLSGKKTLASPNTTIGVYLDL